MKRIDSVSVDVTFHSAKDADAALQNEWKCQNAAIANIILVPIPSELEIAEQTINAEIGPNSSNQTTFLDLNDDCLLSILERCDLDARSSLWQVCHRTRYLLEKFLLSKEDTEYKILYGSHPDELLRVPKRVRENMIYLGSRVKKLRLELGWSFVHNYGYPYPPEIHKTVEHCSKFVGASINEIEFIRMPNYLDCFRQNQALNKVEKLTISNFVGWSGQIKSRLPNLKQLKYGVEDLGCQAKLHEIGATRSTGSELDFIKSQLNLEKLTIRRVVHNQMLKTLLQNNLQLKCLELVSDIHQSLPMATLNDLQHLEELIIYGLVAGTQLLDNVGNLRMLKKLGLQFTPRDLHDDSWFAVIFNGVLRLKTLRSIMLRVRTTLVSRRERFHESILRMGRDLPHLEHFFMNYENHDYFSESFIIDFVKIATNLRTFWLVGSSVGCIESQVTHDFMRKLADVRKRHFGDCPNGIILLELICSDSTPSPQQTQNTVRISTLNIMDLYFQFIFFDRSILVLKSVDM